MAVPQQLLSLLGRRRVYLLPTVLFGILVLLWLQVCVARARVRVWLTIAQAPADVAVAPATAAASCNGTGGTKASSMRRADATGFQQGPPMTAAALGGRPERLPAPGDLARLEPVLDWWSSVDGCQNRSRHLATDCHVCILPGCEMTQATVKARALIAKLTEERFKGRKVSPLHLYPYLESAEMASRHALIAHWLAHRRPQRIIEIGGYFNDIRKFIHGFCPELIVSVDPLYEPSSYFAACGAGRTHIIMLPMTAAELGQKGALDRLSPRGFDAVVCIGCDSQHGPSRALFDSFPPPVDFYLEFARDYLPSAKALGGQWDGGITVADASLELPTLRSQTEFTRRWFRLISFARRPPPPIPKDSPPRVYQRPQNQRPIANMSKRTYFDLAVPAEALFGTREYDTADQRLNLVRYVSPPMNTLGYAIRGLLRTTVWATSGPQWLPVAVGEVAAARALTDCSAPGKVAAFAAAWREAQQRADFLDMQSSFASCSGGQQAQFCDVLLQTARAILVTSSTQPACRTVLAAAGFALARLLDPLLRLGAVADHEAPPETVIADAVVASALAWVVSDRAVDSLVWGLTVRTAAALHAAWIAVYSDVVGPQRTAYQRENIPLVFPLAWPPHGTADDIALAAQLEPLEPTLRNLMWAETGVLISFTPYRVLPSLPAFQSRRFARRILFDIGTNGFRRSAKVLIDMYAVYAKFDTVYLVEPDVGGMSDVPPAYRSAYKIEFINQYIEVGSHDANDVMTIIRQRVAVEDFVVVKFDVDEGSAGPTMEWGFLRSLVDADRGAAKLVDELFIELHYWNAEIHWRHQGHSMWEAFDVMRSLRAAGVAVHAWP
jgi:hypothetical protein